MDSGKDGGGCMMRSRCSRAGVCSVGQFVFLSWWCLLLYYQGIFVLTSAPFLFILRVSNFFHFHFFVYRHPSSVSFIRLEPTRLRMPLISQGIVCTVRFVRSFSFGREVQRSGHSWANDSVEGYQAVTPHHINFIHPYTSIHSRSMIDNNSYTTTDNLFHLSVLPSFHLSFFPPFNWLTNPPANQFNAP